jgi:hypothetical protein
MTRNHRVDGSHPHPAAGSNRCFRRQESNGFRGHTDVRFEEAHMQTRFIPRLLTAGLLLAFIFAGMNHLTANAKSGQTDLWGEGLLHLVDWTEQNTQEDVLVQKCDGFDITSSYTVNIAHHLTTDNSGNEVLERMNVDFAGAIGNGLTGKSYAYDGTFIRWSDYIRNKVTINDLELRFEVGTPGEFTVAVDRIEMDLVADPAVVVKQFVPNTLQMELCYLLSDASSVSVSTPPRYYADIDEPQTCADRARPGVPLPC